MTTNPNGTPYVFDPTIHPQSIILVGCGGTGAQLARTIARIAYQLQSSRRSTPQITFIDPDTVEPANLGRQLFGPGDLGHNKAVVLAERFNYAYGLRIRALARGVRETDFARSRQQIVCDAVDNAAARRIIAAGEPALVISCGNHYESGQVLIGSHQDADRWFDWRADNGDFRYLPYPWLLFPELIEDEPEPANTEHLSCAELVEAGQQALLVNDFMGAIAGQYLYKLLYREPITAFASFVDLDTLSLRSIPITPENLAAYLDREPPA